jgi:hypothetical protein
MSATDDIMKLYKECYSEEDVQEECPHNLNTSMDAEAESMDDEIDDIDESLDV